MDYYLVTLRVGELPDLAEHNDNKDAIVEWLVQRMKDGVVILDGSQLVERGEIDNHADSQMPVLETECVFEVHLEVEEAEGVSDESSTVDFHDGGESLHYYIVDALELRAATITYDYSDTAGALTRRVIGIDLEMPPDTLSLDDYDEIMKTLDNGTK